jgi:hypothetical protein
MPNLRLDQSDEEEDEVLTLLLRAPLPPPPLARTTIEGVGNRDADIIAEENAIARVDLTREKSEEFLMTNS